MASVSMKYGVHLIEAACFQHKEWALVHKNADVDLLHNLQCNCGKLLHLS